MNVSVSSGGRARSLVVKQSILLIGMTLATAVLSAGCATQRPPPTVERLDLARFMGDWYVEGGILTWFERGAHNALESYRLDEQGRIQTTYTFRRGAFDGPEKSYPSVAFVHNRETMAEWRIQFFRPFRFPYLVLHLDPDYQTTAIGTDDRKYLWIMSRTPAMDESAYAEIVRRMGELGFDTNRVVRVPQQPLAERGSTAVFTPAPSGPGP